VHHRKTLVHCMCQYTATRNVVRCLQKVSQLTSGSLR